jgi:hypothetical protein
MRLLLRPRSALGALAVLAVLAFAPPVGAQKWGTIKGQVVFGGKGMPKIDFVDVNKDQAHCLRNGKIAKQNWTVNKSNKGVRYAVVYLIDAKNFKAALPINPKLAKLPGKTITVDQPCCMFEPRVVALQGSKDTLEVKNTAEISHNVKIDGGPLGPNENKILPPNTSLTLKKIAARPTGIPISCSIHGWMNGYVFSFNHPYFAVTDKDGKFEIKNAPAGKYKLVIWHEEAGWVTGGKSPMRGGGKVITIAANKTTDLGKFKANP